MVISTRKLINYTALLVIAAYAFSQMSLANLLPVKNWIIIMGFFTVVAFIYAVSHSVTMFRYISLDEAVLLIMMLIILLWDNYNLKHGNWAYEAFFVILTIWYIILKRWEGWYEFAFRGMSYVGVFYALMTIFSMAIPSFYSGFVYPLISSCNTMYSETYLAGFTSHYSSNGMYLAISICFSFCYLFFLGKNSSKLKSIVILCVTAAALLISSKRGPLVCLGVAFVFTYYIYHCDKPLTRWFKLICLIMGAIVVFSFAAQFVPELNNVVDRFITQAAKGDITTQRVYIWAEAIPAFWRKPLFGNGWCWFRYHNTYGVEYHVHNVYLQWLTEVGIIGSIPFFFFFISTFIKTLKMLIAERKYRINIRDNSEFYLSISLCFQTFFIPFCFEGTAFYEVQILLPYLICCVVANQIWGEYQRMQRED